MTFCLTLPCAVCYPAKNTTFGNFLNFNPHLHIIATDGCFYDQDGFIAGPQPDPKALEHAFRLEVFKMLKKEGKVSDAVIDNMLNWHNSGFNIFCSRATDWVITITTAMKMIIRSYRMRNSA